MFSHLNYQNQPAWEGTSFIAAFFKFQSVVSCFTPEPYFAKYLSLNPLPCISDWTWNTQNWVHHFLLLLFLTDSHHQSLRFLIFFFDYVSVNRHPKQKPGCLYDSFPQPIHLPTAPRKAYWILWSSFLFYIVSFHQYVDLKCACFTLIVFNLKKNWSNCM